MKPHLKMIIDEFVGPVPLSDLREGDLIPEGVVVGLDYDGGEVFYETPAGLYSGRPKDEVVRFARLTKVAFEHFRQTYDAERKRLTP